MHIVIVKESSYEYAKLKADAFEILSGLDRGLIKPGANVLIKPNLLTAAKEEKAITTHPLLIKAVCQYVLDKGARPQVSDSPPLEPLEKVIKAAGIADALKGMGVSIKEFKDSRKVMSEGKFRGIELAEDALDAEVIINLPKLKTHGQMMLTLAVKNLFGCVVGMKKPEWHFRVGEDRMLFAELLLSIYQALSPRINLMDGVLAMEGNGPGAGGTPRHLGILIGGDDALSLDVAASRLLGVDPFTVPVIKKAHEAGLINEFEIKGGISPVKNFMLPETADLMFGHRVAQRFLRRHLTSRPKSIRGLCMACNECVKMCPAKAISPCKTPKAKQPIEFDYEKCIRCYCCLEVCPHGALKIDEPLLRRALKKAGGRYRL
ncbi:MAG: DUF362 domain-containing protein [Thermodesulfovibrionales bacterium]|nr:DUF362 domain-containing protein [Thermodesulfovibrionales bacterium]